MFDNTSTANCISGGKATTGINGTIMGIISDWDRAYGEITHCYWTSDIGFGEACGSANVTVTESSLVSQLDTATLTKMNEYAEPKGLSKWIMLHLNGGKINELSQENIIVTQYYFPKPVKDADFLGWYTDAACTNPFDPTMVNSTEIFAKYDEHSGGKTHTVTYDFHNGTVETKNFNHGDPIIFPDTYREGYEFEGWYMDSIFSISFNSAVVLEDYTLHAKYKKIDSGSSFALGLSPIFVLLSFFF